MQSFLMISAVLIAMSEPKTMAIPTSVRIRASESLMPSSAIVLGPSLWKSRISFDYLPGRTSSCTLPRPNSLLKWVDVRKLNPVIRVVYAGLTLSGDGYDRLVAAWERRHSRR